MNRIYGATREDFGKHRRRAARQCARIPARADEEAADASAAYLAARPIADPIHLFDCVMPCAGAEAFLVCAEERARDLGLPFVHILSTIERHNAFMEDPIQYRGGWVVDLDDLYGLADVKPADVDLLQTYDDYPVISLMQIEDLGFCAKGKAAAFIRERDLTFRGDFPHNTSGGQLSVGQAGAAGGYLGLVEAIRQLSGRAGGNQVEGALVASSRASA